LLRINVAAAEFGHGGRLDSTPGAGPRESHLKGGTASANGCSRANSILLFV
jgi:hypothetical protein